MIYYLIYNLLYMVYMFQLLLILGGGWGRGCDRMIVDLQLRMQSVPITTDVVSSNLNQGEVYNIMW
jgi:lipoprotein signal peptidase